MKILPLSLLLWLAPGIHAAEPVAKAGLWETVLKNRQIETAVDQPIARFGKNKGPDPQGAGTTSPAAQTSGADAPGQGKGLVEQVCVGIDALTTVGMPAPVRRDCEYKTRWNNNVAVIQTFCNGVVTSGEVSYPNDKSYNGWILPSAPWGMGRIEISGRWISDDCGSLSP